jgi:hypothetical protein
MTATTSLLERPDVHAAETPSASADSALEWEAAAGGGAAAPRVTVPAYAYHGYGDPHLIGQPCSLLGPGSSEAATCLVVFACGCRSRVSKSALKQRS